MSVTSVTRRVGLKGPSAVQQRFEEGFAGRFRGVGDLWCRACSRQIHVPGHRLVATHHITTLG